MAVNTVRSNVVSVLLGLSLLALVVAVCAGPRPSSVSKSAPLIDLSPAFAGLARDHDLESLGLRVSTAAALREFVPTADPERFRRVLSTFAIVRDTFRSELLALRTATGHIGEVVDALAGARGDVGQAEFTLRRRSPVVAEWLGFEASRQRLAGLTVR